MRAIKHFLREKTVDLQELADKLGVHLHISERPTSIQKTGAPRFYASLRGVETIDGGVLVGTHGNGNTPESAVTDYCRSLIGKHIVRSAYSDDRVELGPYTNVTWDGKLDD